MRKTILIAALTIISATCFAQKNINNAKQNKDTTFYSAFLGSSGTTWGPAHVTANEPKYDTTEVHILCSDSSNVLRVIKAFDVREYSANGRLYIYSSTDDDFKFTGTHKQYLDENKQPLSKSLIVWQVQ